MLSYKIDTLGFVTTPRPELLIDYANKKASEIIKSLSVNVGRFEPATLRRELVEAKLVNSPKRKGPKKHGIFEDVEISVKWPKVEVTFLGPDA